MSTQHSFRAVLRNLILVVFFVLASCVQPQIIITVSAAPSTPTLSDATASAQGTLETPPASPTPLKVTKNITATCDRHGNLKHAIVNLDVSGGVQPYSSSPESPFAIQADNEGYIELTVQSQDGQKWTEILVVSTLCREKENVAAPNAATQKPVDATSPPNSKPTTQPNDRPTKVP